VHEFGWDKSRSVPRYRSKRGAEFDENSPNLTEDVNFEIGSILVGIEGPEDLQSSGIESKYRRKRSENDILMMQGGC